MQIQTTKDYDLFKSIDANRKVDPAHVRKLAASIDKKNLLTVNPVIVNGNMEIIDGQHRVAACRQLQIEVHYMMVGGVQNNDIHMLNSTNKKWTLTDYINYHAVEGSPNFIEINKLIDSNPNMTVHTLIMLSSKHNFNNNVRDGALDISHIDHARRVSGWIKQISNAGFAWAYKSAHLALVLKQCSLLVPQADFQFDILFTQIKANPKKLIKFETRKEFQALIENLYNTNSKKPNKLVLTKSADK